LNRGVHRRSTRVPAPATESSWWSRIAHGFTPERLDDLERVLLPLVGRDEAALLHPWLCRRHAAAVLRVDRLPWEADPAGAANSAHEILVATVDSDDDQGDIPWTRALVGLVDSPRLASELAQRWWGRMARAHVDDRERSATVFAVSAYAVGACVGLLEVAGERSANDVVGWLKRADRHMHFENGLDLVLVVRAARLLQPLLERARAGSGTGRAVTHIGVIEGGPVDE